MANGPNWLDIDLEGYADHYPDQIPIARFNELFGLPGVPPARLHYFRRTRWAVVIKAVEPEKNPFFKQTPDAQVTEIGVRYTTERDFDTPGVPAHHCQDPRCLLEVVDDHGQAFSMADQNNLMTHLDVSEFKVTGTQFSVKITHRNTSVERHARLWVFCSSLMR